MSPEEALLGFTAAAAKVLCLERDRGTLEPGKRADLALWERREISADLCYWVGASPLAVPCKGRRNRGRGTAEDTKQALTPCKDLLDICGMQLRPGRG